MCTANFVLTSYYWHDSALLNGRRAFEAVCVDTPEKFVFEVHLVEMRHGLIAIGVKLACGHL